MDAAAVAVHNRVFPSLFWALARSNAEDEDWILHVQRVEPGLSNQSQNVVFLQEQLARCIKGNSMIRQSSSDILGSVDNDGHGLIPRYREKFPILSYEGVGKAIRMVNGDPAMPGISKLIGANDWTPLPIKPFRSQTALVHSTIHTATDTDNSPVLDTDIKSATVTGIQFNYYSSGMRRMEDGSNLPTQNTGTLDPFVWLGNHIIIPPRRPVILVRSPFPVNILDVISVCAGHCFSLGRMSLQLMLCVFSPGVPADFILVIQSK